MKTIKMCLLATAVMLMSFTPEARQNLLVKNNQAVIGKAATIKWKSLEMDLGEILQNKPVPVTFEFKNTGEVPIVISGVQASCGCTTTNFSKTPVLPGETSVITATYNAANKGSFKKTVTVTTNAEEGTQVLTISGSVI